MDRNSAIFIGTVKCECTYSKPQFRGIFWNMTIQTEIVMYMITGVCLHCE